MSKFSDLAAATHPNTTPKQPKDASSPASKPRNLTSAELHVRGAILAQNEALTKRVEQLKTRVGELEQSPGLLQIPIEQLHEIPGRKRNLDVENYETLKNNLANNDLITPIIVRNREAGGYEIISGHNRTQAFRELGRKSIPAVIADISDEDADKDAFFANLIHSSLPDYEKYLGFEKLLAEQPNLTQEALATSIGVPKTTLSSLLSFRRLPQAAHELLKRSPNTIGYRAASELAQQTEDGQSDLVIRAIERIANKELDQTKAKDWIKKELQAVNQDKSAKVIAKPIVIKKGKSTFCHMRQSNKVIRLEFQSVDEAEHIQEQIHNFLKSLAKDGT